MKRYQINKFAAICLSASMALGNVSVVNAEQFVTLPGIIGSTESEQIENEEVASEEVVEDATEEITDGTTEEIVVEQPETITPVVPVLPVSPMLPNNDLIDVSDIIEQREEDAADAAKGKPNTLIGSMPKALTDGFTQGYFGSTSILGDFKEIDGGVELSAQKGKISGSADQYNYYYIEKSDADSYSLSVDMKVTGIYTAQGDLSNQSVAGIMFRDDINANASAMASTGIRVTATGATSFNPSNILRKPGTTSLTYDTNTGISGSIGDDVTYKLKLDKFGDVYKLSVNDHVTYFDSSTLYTTAGDTSYIGIFAARSLTAQFTNMEFTEYSNEAVLEVITPSKTNYIQEFDTSFDDTGFVVKYDGRVLDSSEYIMSGFDVSTVGTKTVTVSYGAKTATFDIEVVAPELTKLDIIYSPVKDVYYKDQALDLTGLTLKRTYNNNDSYTRTSKYSDADFNTLFTVSDLDTTVGGTQTVTITPVENPEVTASFDVSVLLYELTGLQITAPAKTTYYVGDGTDGVVDLDTKGMVIKSVYSLDTASAQAASLHKGLRAIQTKTERIELNDADLVIGKVATVDPTTAQEVPVTYKTVSGVVKVDVVAVAPQSVAISTLPKTTYNKGEAFNAEGIVVTATNNNGTTFVVDSANYTVDASAVKADEAGTYVVNVNVSSPIEKQLTFNATYREVFVPAWNSVFFGQSTTLTGIAADGSKKNDVIVTGDLNEGGSVQVKSIEGAGKVTGAQDGIAYYYFELDPSKDNFVVEADVKVNKYSKDVSGTTMKHDGQESFGIMARDAINTNGDSATFASNIAAVGGYSGSTTANNGIQGFIRTGVNPSDSEAVIAMEVKRLTNERGYQMVGQTYKLKLEKDNTGFLMSVNGGTPERIYADSDLMAQLYGDKMYVGFYAAREADIEVSNVNVSVTDQASDAPQIVKPVNPVTPAIPFTSLNKFGGASYDLAFTPNVNGVVKVKQGATILADEFEVKQGVEVKLPTTLSVGDNNFSLEFWPDSTQNITSQAKITSYFTVNHKVLGSDGKVYVSNTGVSTNDGTSANPVNIQTALDYASAGQTIYLAGGTYNLTTALVAPKGVNGTADAPIVVRPLSENGSPIVFDFGSVGDGVRVNGDYWHFYKINCTGTRGNSNGIVLTGNHNILESSNAYKNGNTGIQISALSGNASRDIWPTYNTVINCTSYENADPSNNNADGFAAKITVGKGNQFIGCIARDNADDGWDLYSKTESGPIEAVTLINCVAYNNGYINGVATGGDMNGFKLGGEGQPVTHTIIKSLAFNNGANGFDSNSNPSVVAMNNVSYNNAKANANFTTYGNITPKFDIDNFISYYTADYENKSKDNYASYQEPLTDIFNETTYYSDGAVTANSKGDVFVDDLFPMLEVPTTIERTEDVFGSTQANIEFGNLWTQVDKFFAGELVTDRQKLESLLEKAKKLALSNDYTDESKENLVAVITDIEGRTLETPEDVLDAIADLQEAIKALVVVVDDSEDNNSNSSSNNGKGNVVESGKDKTVISNPNSRVTITLPNKETNSKAIVEFKVGKVDEKHAKSAIEHSKSNEALLKNTATEIKVTEGKDEVKKFDFDISLTFDLSKIEIPANEKANLVAVRFNPDGTMSFLGGKYDEKNGVFNSATKNIDGTFAVIVADFTMYNQIELKIGSTDMLANSESGTLEAAPVIVEDTTYVPIRFVSENLGADVSYDAVTKTASIELDGKTVEFTTGKAEDNKAPFIVNGRMLVPVRYVSENLGANVIWSEEDKSIQITK